MTSLRQIKANRCNTLKSTGPKTTLGKQHSRCNAMRHGLTAETVIQFLEDQEDYKAFELSVTADFDARTAVERQLVLRLAGLLWRLRRATAVESGLLQIHSNIECMEKQGDTSPPMYDDYYCSRCRTDADGTDLQCEDCSAFPHSQSCGRRSFRAT